MNDGLSTLFEEMEASHAAALLGEGIAAILPRTLVVRPPAPKLPSTVVVLGQPALRSKPQAERFAQVLIEEARLRE